MKEFIQHFECEVFGDEEQRAAKETFLAACKRTPVDPDLFTHELSWSAETRIFTYYSRTAS